tara:strand:- start:2694 stop:3299 length:606 start_codon:yes stop_codon:yes gene_type:complete
MTITNIVKTLFFVVTGHRQNVVDSWSDEERNHFWSRTRAFFDYMEYTYDHVVMFNGMANGVDRMFYNFAKKNFPSFQIIEMPCTSEMWTKFGKKAGHIRNVQMLNSAIDHAVSTYHSSGDIPVEVDVRLLSALEPKVTWTYDYKKRQTGGTLHCTQAGVELFGADHVKFIWESPERRELWRAHKAEFDAKEIHQLSLLTNS